MLEMVEKLSPEVRMLGVGIEAMTTGCSVTAGSLLIPDPAQVWLLPRA